MCGGSSGAVDQHVLVVRSVLGLGHRGPDVGHRLTSGLCPRRVGLMAGEVEGRYAIVPALLGQWRRLFDHFHPKRIERTRVLEGDGVTSLNYRSGGRRRGTWAI